MLPKDIVNKTWDFKVEVIDLNTLSLTSLCSSHPFGYSAKAGRYYSEGSINLIDCDGNVVGDVGNSDVPIFRNFTWTRSFPFIKSTMVHEGDPWVIFETLEQALLRLGQVADTVRYVLVLPHHYRFSTVILHKVPRQANLRDWLDKKSVDASEALRAKLSQ